MAASAAPKNCRELEEKIVALAWKDDGFRKKFLADPKQQFEEKLGAKLPATLKITAYQEDETSLHFVIPAKPKVNLSELSDEDLERVAGGIDVLTTIGIASAIVMLGSFAATASHAAGEAWAGK